MTNPMSKFYKNKYTTKTKKEKNYLFAQANISKYINYGAENILQRNFENIVNNQIIGIQN